MLFTSTQFFIFFPVVTALYFLLPHRFRWLLLLTASSLFYMAFIPKYILILFFTIIVDYIAGIQIEAATGRKRKLYLILSLIANLGVLAIFKYYNFFLGNLNDFAQLIHWNYSLSLLNIILPLGLSFHTFQAMSYTIEVFRGNYRAERHFGIYALYVMFYPQLVAGPIERPQNLLPQFREEHAFVYSRVIDGLKLMLMGFFKKLVIADQAAFIVDSVYSHPGDYTGLPLIIATVFFAFQIFCDFSGYTDIARGAARVMGFRLRENFNQPYFATSVADFWRRWHMSLSTWFRDYLYFSLGGNRVSKLRWYFNILLVFLLSGLWHGANWTFVIWGALHGTYIVLSKITTWWRESAARFIRLDRFPRVRKLAQIFITFFLVAVGWVFFRSRDLSEALYILKHALSGLWSQLSSLEYLRYELLVETTLGVSKSTLLVLIASIVLMLGIYWSRERPWWKRLLALKPTALRWSLYYAFILWLLLFGVFTEQNFIYFQF
ncbi:MAG TPA: membrane-bound O-acyltransferase family protein [Candidatus Taylorbacteria bacterium]|nr:MAG: Membrane bound O-acyl transferase MBOAT family protein [Parcubacteria group bacterium GW2011_GWA2_47_64]KKU96530.1 MAG: Membrane bound O-acyl transferase MBOAT family protein [Parcubacteria group bacterium GW2011_GWC2_48_17]HBV01189.1 membrane-bound O-acyltransferase family protein [Candidatus Taylorbacteria bacterium]